MKSIKTSLVLMGALLIADVVPTKIQAASLMLDFGPTATLPGDALKSPGHVIGAIPASEISWNTISGDNSSLVYSDGSAATGVSIDLGRSSAVGPVGDDIIDFSNHGFTVNALGTSQNNGVYSGTSPVRDGIFGGSGGTNNLAVGLRVDGLAPGTYTVYVHGRNSNTGGAAPLLFYARTGASTVTYSFTPADLTAALLNSSPAITNGFVQGENFGVLTVVIAAGQSLFLASEGTAALETRGFMNAIQIVPGVPAISAKVTSQPTSRTNLQTATAVIFAGVAGDPPLTLQWRFNNTDLVEGPNISGVNSNVLTLRDLTPAMAGNYSLFVSNSLGFQTSSNALLTVSPALQTEQMSQLWTLVPGERSYLGTGSTERGIAYNAATTNLLLVSRLPSERVVVLDPQTGSEKHFLDVTGVSGGTFPLSMIGVADDGVVLAAGLTVNAGTLPLNIYRWPSDAPGVAPTMVFTGDPGVGVQSNQRYGDNMTVRGAGAETQILLAPAAGTNVVLLRTGDGIDFQNSVPPCMISVTGVPSGFARLGIAFGHGNTFWAKSANSATFLIQFDPDTKTGFVLKTYPGTMVPGSVRGIGVDKEQKFLAGVAVEAPNDNVRLYDISDLVVGPLLRDQEAFSTQNANGNGTASIAFGGNYLFALDTDNGIKTFLINTNYAPPSVTIPVQPTPASRTVLAGASATFSATAASSFPLVLQWRWNGTNLVDGPNISGANSSVLTIRNTTTNSVGNYSLFATNEFGSALSSNAVLFVNVPFNTPQMTNIWNLDPNERTYLGTNYTERGLAYNSLTTNLLLVSRSTNDPSPPTVVVLDPFTGAEKHLLDTSGIFGTAPGSFLGLNAIGVADDGAVFAASLTVNAPDPAFNIHRWADDSAGTPPFLVFAGDPGFPASPNLRWGDVMAVRGGGADTQILVSPGSGTNVVLLRSTSGVNFQEEIPPAIISVSDVQSGFAQMGLAFGPGTNTFWAKNVNNALFLVQFDLETGTGTVIRSNNIPGLRGIAVDKTQRFLSGLMTESSGTVRLYDISNPLSEPELRDQEVFAAFNANVTSGGSGVTAFGGNYLFALNSNNGIKAFLLDTNYVPPITSFAFTSVTHANDSVILTWETVAGRSYRLLYKDSLTDATWSNQGGFVTATSDSMSVTNSLSSSTARFYQVELQ